MDLTYEQPTTADLDCVTAQLQRSPRGALGVAVRCRYGRPQVIVSHPLRLDGRPAVDATADDVTNATRVEVFPTLFWLTCPYLNRVVGRLESVGWVGRLKEGVGADAGLAAELWEAHRTTAAFRSALIPDTVLASLAEHYPGQHRVLTQSGVAGMDFQTDPSELGIKCLHAHLADYLARGKNPVGRRVWALLATQGEDPRGQGACFEAVGCACPPAASDRPVAVMDVGSNTVRLLVARRSGIVRGEAPMEIPSLVHGSSQGRPGEMRRPALEIMHRNMATTRIGAGVSSSGKIDAAAADQTLAALRKFRAEAERLGAPEPICVGTSALREAADAPGFLIRAWEEAGISVRVISGEEEAALSFEGAAAALAGGGEGGGATGRGVGGVGGAGGGAVQAVLDKMTVIDIGGGSTEIIWHDPNGPEVKAHSLPIGVVRLLQQFPDGDAQAASAMRERVRASVVQVIAAAPPETRSRLVAVGGTATSVGAMALRLDVYDPAKVTGVRLTVADLQEWIDHLVSLNEFERRDVPGLQPERADVIVPGLVILQEMLVALSQSGWITPEVTVCDSDLMHALAARELALHV